MSHSKLESVYACICVNVSWNTHVQLGGESTDRGIQSTANALVFECLMMLQNEKFNIHFFINIIFYYSISLTDTEIREKFLEKIK